MIRFACVYCGEEMAVEDAQATRLTPCPACAHTLRVPRKHAPEPIREEPQETAGRPPQWERMSNKDIARLLLSKRRPGVDRTPEAMRLAASPFLPRYDDLTLFTLSVTLLLLLLIRPHVDLDPVLRVLGPRVHLAPGVRTTGGPLVNVVEAMVKHFGLFIVLGVFGMAASLVGVFFRQAKPVPIKYAMMSFAVLITAGTGIYAGYIELTTTRHWFLMIFPAWNVLSGVFLLLMLRIGLMDEDCVTDQHAQFWQIVLTVLCVGTIVGVCHYIFLLHWTITYSICVCYTTTLNRTLAKLLGKCTPPV